MSDTGKSSFFKQSGWLVIATFSGGIFMMLSQTMAAKMPDAEFSVYNALLRLMILLSVPSAALQSIFAQQSAGAVDEEKQKSLIATSRALLVATAVIWVCFSAIIVAFTGPITRALDVPQPVALWLTAFVMLPTLIVPIFKGILQGTHQFGGLGWLQISDGICRFVGLLVIVLALSGTASKALVAVSLGLFTTLVMGAWLTRGIWTKPASVPVAWKGWLKHALPLTMGMGAIVAMTTIDSLFVKRAFDESHHVSLYMAGMLTGFAITQFIAPVALVMFPRLVRSKALAQKSDALMQTFMATAVFGIAAMIGCTLLPKLVVRCMFFTNHDRWDAWPLVPWFAWGNLPLTLANVLIQNLLAHHKYKATPFIMAVPIVFAFSLYYLLPGWKSLPDMVAFTRVAQAFGLANLALLLIAAGFTWGKK